MIVVDGFLSDDGVDLVGSVKLGVVGVVVLMVSCVNVRLYWIVVDGFSSSEGVALVVSVKLVVLAVVMLLVSCVNSIGLFWVQL